MADGMECGELDPHMFPKYIVDRYTTTWREGLLFVLNFGFTVVGIIANCLGLYFFIKKQRKDLTTRLFIALCAVDLATCLTVGPFQILVNVRAINYYDVSTQHFLFFSIMSAISGIEIRFSMFLFMVMSFCRCISILRPFRRHKQRLIIGILVVYLVLCTIMMGIPVFACYNTSLIPYTNVPFARMGQMELFSAGETDGDAEADVIVYMAFLEVITMIAPVVPITITSCITAYNLLFSPAMRAASNNNASRRDGAVTILILTASTLVCFFPRLLITVSGLITMADLSEYTITDKLIEGTEFAAAYTYLYLLLTGLSLANSCINPCVFLVRGQNMKIFLRKQLRMGSRGGARQTVRGGCTSMSVMNNKTMDTVLSNGSGLLQSNSKAYQDTKI